MRIIKNILVAALISLFATFSTYAEKVTKDEAQIDWHQSAEQISRVIRAFNPRPIAYTNALAKQFENRVLRIIEAEVVKRQTTSSPGKVIKYDKDVCYIATSNGVINLKKVQIIYRSFPTPLNLCLVTYHAPRSNKGLGGSHLAF